MKFLLIIMGVFQIIIAGDIPNYPLPFEAPGRTSRNPITHYIKSSLPTTNGQFLKRFLKPVEPFFFNLDIEDDNEHLYAATKPTPKGNTTVPTSYKSKSKNSRGDSKSTSETTSQLTQQNADDSKRRLLTLLTRRGGNPGTILMEDDLFKNISSSDRVKLLKKWMSSND